MTKPLRRGRKIARSGPSENALLLRAALKHNGVPVETHLFAIGGHGFGLRKAIGKPAEKWPETFVEWAKSHGV